MKSKESVDAEDVTEELFEQTKRRKTISTDTDIPNSADQTDKDETPPETTEAESEIKAESDNQLGSLAKFCHPPQRYTFKYFRIRHSLCPKMESFRTLTDCKRFGPCGVISEILHHMRLQCSTENPRDFSFKRQKIEQSAFESDDLSSVTQLQDLELGLPQLGVVYMSKQINIILTAIQKFGVPTAKRKDKAELSQFIDSKHRKNFTGLFTNWPGTVKPFASWLIKHQDTKKQKNTKKDKKKDWLHSTYVHNRISAWRDALTICTQEGELYADEMKRAFEQGDFASPVPGVLCPYEVQVGLKVLVSQTINRNTAASEVVSKILLSAGIHKSKTSVVLPTNQPGDVTALLKQQIKRTQPVVCGILRNKANDVYVMSIDWVSNCVCVHGFHMVRCLENEQQKQFNLTSVTTGVWDIPDTSSINLALSDCDESPQSASDYEKSSQVSSSSNETLPDQGSSDIRITKKFPIEVALSDHDESPQSSSDYEKSSQVSSSSNETLPDQGSSDVQIAKKIHTVHLYTGQGATWPCKLYNAVKSDLVRILTNYNVALVEENSREWKESYVNNFQQMYSDFHERKLILLEHVNEFCLVFGCKYSEIKLDQTKENIVKHVCKGIAILNDNGTIAPTQADPVISQDKRGLMELLEKWSVPISPTMYVKVTAGGCKDATKDIDAWLTNKKITDFVVKCGYSQGGESFMLMGSDWKQRFAKYYNVASKLGQPYIIVQQKNDEPVEYKCIVVCGELKNVERWKFDVQTDGTTEDTNTKSLKKSSKKYKDCAKLVAQVCTSTYTHE